MEKVRGGCSIGSFSGMGLSQTFAEMPCSCKSLARLVVLLKVVVGSLLLVRDSPIVRLQDMAGELTIALTVLFPLLPQDNGGYMELGVT